MLTYKEKHAQANREALATVIGLLATIVVWTLAGFGLSAFDISIFHTPLWVIGGTLGTLAFAIVVAVVLARRVFKDFDLDDDVTDGQGICHIDASTECDIRCDPLSHLEARHE